jgi:drug/metabolite transporter (DMT)-like permease
VAVPLDVFLKGTMSIRELKAPRVPAVQAPIKPGAISVDDRQRNSSRLLVVLAFAAVYLIWGSTYLGIKYAIQTLPPFMMAATRFLTAGAILFIWASIQGRDETNGIRLSSEQWRRAFVIGALLLLCGNGGVTWAERYLPSGLTALLVATEPLWVVIMNWAWSGKRPNAKVFVGLFAGLAGVALLVSGGLTGTNASGPMSLIGAGVVILAGFAWASGSVYSLRRPVQASPVLAAGSQMLTGGALLLIAALLTGEFGRLNLRNTSWVSIGSLVYLIVFGSLVAFTAYSWLLRKVAPASAATYAYVNPPVAVLLGWLLAGEPVTMRMLLGAAVIVGSVVLIITYGGERKISRGGVGEDSDPRIPTSETQRLSEEPCPTLPCA